MQGLQSSIPQLPKLGQSPPKLPLLGPPEVGGAGAAAIQPLSIGSDKAYYYSFSLESPGGVFPADHPKDKTFTGADLDDKGLIDMILLLINPSVGESIEPESRLVVYRFDNEPAFERHLHSDADDGKPFLEFPLYPLVQQLAFGHDMLDLQHLHDTQNLLLCQQHQKQFLQLIHDQEKEMLIIAQTPDSAIGSSSLSG